MTPAPAGPGQDGHHDLGVQPQDDHHDLGVEPQDGHHDLGVEPEYLGQQLSEGLARGPRVGELGLAVDVGRGGVFVSGTVTTQRRRQAVEEVVAELAPGLPVHNDVKVVNEQGRSGVERVK